MPKPFTAVWHDVAPAHDAVGRINRQDLNATSCYQHPHKTTYSLGGRRLQECQILALARHTIETFSKALNVRDCRRDDTGLSHDSQGCVLPSKGGVSPAGRESSKRDKS